MATITAGNYGLAGRTLGTSKWEGLEANSQTFIVNSLVYDSSGTVAACASDPALVKGLATKAATNVTTGNINIPVVVITPQTKLWMQVMNGTTAAAGSASYLGNKYGITVASGIAYFDISETTTTKVSVLRKHPDDAHTDTNCRYEVSFLDSVLQK